jgi:4'-phosphopantetheinyl transferase
LIKVNYINIKEIGVSTFEEGLRNIPLVMRTSLLKYRVEEDRIRGLSGKLLLKKLLIEMGYSESVLCEVRLDQYNRPYLNKEVDFNIAHSGNYVICGISRDTKVGLDIEQIKTIDIKSFDTVFSNEERVSLKNSNNPINEFYSIWSQKEAVSKADGRGLGIPFLNIKIKGLNVNVEDDEWLLREMKIDPNYKSYIAYKGDRRVEIEEVKNIDLKNII